MVLWNEIYQQCCDVLLESGPAGFQLGLITDSEFFTIAGEVLLDFCSKTSLVKKIFCDQIAAGVAVYDEYQLMDECQSVVAMQTHMDRESGYMLDNTDPEWATLYDFPQTYREDQLPPKQLQLSPNPNVTGNQVATVVGGYGVLSSTVPGEFDITSSLAGPGYGTPCAFGGNPYVEGVNPGYGVLARAVPSTGNLQMFGTALPQNTTNITKQTVIELVPDSFTPYLKYGILARIFSSDSELKDSNKAAYCQARFYEAINLTAALMCSLTASN